MAAGGGEAAAAPPVSRKLTVEVCNARNLMPKDGQGTASSYAIVDFDGQRRRTKTRPRDLNPQWDERLEFLVHEPGVMASETLEVNVYHDDKNKGGGGGGGGQRKGTFLGRVRISGSVFPKAGAESLVYYPLEKRSVFSQVKGEIGLKVCYEDEPAKAAEPPAAGAAATPADAKPEEEKKKNPEGQDGKEPEGKQAEVKKQETQSEEKKKTSPPPEEKKEKAEEAEKEKVESKPQATVKAEEKVGAAKEPSPKEKKQLQLDPTLAVSSPAKFNPSRSGSGAAAAAAGKGGELGHSGAAASYDLVDRVPYLFVRLLRAKHSAGGDRQLYGKVSIGTHSVRTRPTADGEWDQVFAFHKGSLNSTALDVSVWAEKKKDDAAAAGETTTACLGVVSFDLHEIPKRAPPDSPLAPQWYNLELTGGHGGAAGNDVMLAAWIGTQADEAFREAWQSDSGGCLVHTRSKAYLSPKLWYLRLTVIQAQDLRDHRKELYVKGQLGTQVFRTAKMTSSSGSSAGPSWHEDLLFVAAEPFEPFLLVAVEEAASGLAVGQAKVHLSGVHRRSDDRSEPPSQWLNLAAGDPSGYAGRIHVKVCLEGGYHVLDEAAHATSDVRATASKPSSRPPLGMLEVGVRGAANLLPMKKPPPPKDARAGAACGSTDAFVVLKYGQKWVRTRTITEQFNPRWSEQYAWDVFDPCTVLTVAVFDNGNGKDTPIGKVRIRLSTLDANRVYLRSFPLTAVLPGVGAKKMGELELAIRFTCFSWVGLMQAYGTPMLPRMHYVRPLGPAQQDLLRHAAVRAVATRLARSEPPLGAEVVHYMLDDGAQAWSMRRSKANWLRIVGCLSSAAAAARWLHAVRMWSHPTTTVLVHLLMAAVVLCPGLLLPTAFVYLFLYVLWRYRSRPAGPAAGADPRLSCIDAVGADELDEELDGMPTGRPEQQVRARYDRLRTLAGRAQGLLGDVAAQGERVEALVGWRDPRATALFAGACLLAAVVFYAVPFRVLLLAGGCYYLRHPRFRDELPSPAVTFFRRLPSLSDQIL